MKKYLEEELVIYTEHLFTDILRLGKEQDSWLYHHRQLAFTSDLKEAYLPTFDKLFSSEAEEIQSSGLDFMIKEHKSKFIN